MYVFFFASKIHENIEAMFRLCRHEPDRASVHTPRTVVEARFLRRSEAAPLRSLEWRCTHYSYLTFRVGTKSYPVCVYIA